MSRTRQYLPTTSSVMERFFIALEECRAQGKLKVSDYCRDAGIRSRNLYVQRKYQHRGYFEIGWATPLVMKYGVSAFWLLTGLGKMFAPKGFSEYD